MQSRNPDALGRSNDVLDEVAGWLESRSQAGAAADAGRARFYSDASDWLRAVKREMRGLADDFARGIDPDLLTQAAAEAVERVAEQAKAVGSTASTITRDAPESREPARAAAADPSPTASRAGRRNAPREDSETPDPIGRAHQLRAEVAAFREQLRAERLERARAAAESRRAFVDRMRGRPAADPKHDAAPSPPPTPASADDLDDAAPETVQPPTTVNTSTRAHPALAEPAADRTADEPPLPSLSPPNAIAESPELIGLGDDLFGSGRVTFLAHAAVGPECEGRSQTLAPIYNDSSTPTAAHADATQARPEPVPPSPFRRTDLPPGTPEEEGVHTETAREREPAAAGEPAIRFRRIA